MENNQNKPCYFSINIVYVEYIPYIYMVDA